jgi:hypothetical protein
MSAEVVRLGAAGATDGTGESPTGGVFRNGGERRTLTEKVDHARRATGKKHSCAREKTHEAVTRQSD